VPEFAVLRVYLDSNVLFSASYKEENRFLEFWRLTEVIPVTSPFSVGEVLRHVKRPGHAERLAALLDRTEMATDAELDYIPRSVSLVAKDLPILAAAIKAKVDFLVTGDGNHFEHLYGTQVGTTRILKSARFLDIHAYRRID
jgi:predicted nucleic acid-binding protein